MMRKGGVSMSTKDLVRRIDESHRTAPIRRDGRGEPPSNREVKRIVAGAKTLLMPGFYGDGIPETGDRIATARAVRAFRHRLSRQIAGVLRGFSAASDLDVGKHRADELTDRFLAGIPALRELVRADLDAHFQGDPAAFSRDQVALAYPGFYAVLVYRIAHELHGLGVPFLPRMMTEFAHRETGIDIHPGAVIGPRIMIDHGTGVVIGETAVIGAGVRIYQGVTIGALSTRGGRTLSGVKRHPTIGDDVTIYAGASILGGATVVGDGATIGSNAFVTASVAPGERRSMKDCSQEVPRKE
jgi:serine O-acetyltransferase